MHNFASKTQRFRAVLQLRSMSLSNLLNVNQKNEKKKKRHSFIIEYTFKVRIDFKKYMGA